jgi:predicted phosphoribosyltransferase
MLFEDRIDAACQLAQALDRYRGADPLVLAIPRGAVPMGRVLADRLDGDLDVVLVRKLGSPFNPEYAIGAIDESGAFELSGDSDLATVSREYLEREKAAQAARLRARRLVCAVPVASRQGLDLVRPLCGEAVALAVPEPFIAVSRFYRSFSQVEDEEVSELLAA